jgi:hypothetical protein
MKVANSLLEFRAEQLHELETSCGCGKQLGDVTTVNLTGLQVGTGGCLSRQQIVAAANCRGGEGGAARGCCAVDGLLTRLRTWVLRCGITPAWGRRVASVVVACVRPLGGSALPWLRVRGQRHQCRRRYGVGSVGHIVWVVVCFWGVVAHRRVCPARPAPTSSGPSTWCR